MSSVLIVESDRDLREALVEVVQYHGLDTVTAPDGEAALALLRAGPRPTVVLLNTHLAKMDGLSLLAAIRSDAALATVPVVSMSADPRVRPDLVAAHVELPGGVYSLAGLLVELCEVRE